MAKSNQQFQTVRSEGAILPPDVLLRIAGSDLDGLKPDTYHLPPGTKLNEAISRSWTSLTAHWKAFQEARESMPGTDETGTAVTNEKWLLPLFKELEYGRLTTSKSPEVDGRTYSIERFYNHTPIHLIGCKLPLDRRTRGARGAATASPHSMVQEYLNRAPDSLWGFLSNGLRLRVLRDNISLSRQAYVEFDLEAMMEGNVYADFALLWILCHQSRVETDKPTECWLEKWSEQARELGTRVLNNLRTGVATAIEALGRGFIAHPRNDALREKLRSGALDTQDYYRQVLRIVYRMLFLFVAEDRELLHPPNADKAACDLYDTHYSTRRLRDLAHRIRGSKHSDLWHTLSLLIDALGRSEGCAKLGLPALGSFLWNSSSTPDLSGPAPKGAPVITDPVLITNDELLTAVRALAYVEQNRVLRAVDYRNLGSEELGSVYESLLEQHPILNISARSFSLSTAAGNERKTSGSYYTPDSLVQCLLDSALEPVVAERVKGKTGTEAETTILGLKVCDPACGSGHFLIAAAHRLAKHVARARTGESEPSPSDHQHALRDVIGRCIYGVDINPMSVELCKVSLWMEAMEPGKPLSFLDHHIQCGNSLLGATPELIEKGIPDEAFNPIEGDDKEYCKKYKKRNKDELSQMQLDEYAPWEHIGNLPAAMAKLDSLHDDTIEEIEEKQRRYADMIRSSEYVYGKFLADAWCASFMWKKREDKSLPYPITNKVLRQIEKNPKSIYDFTAWLRDEIVRLADQYQFIHWQLVFPEVFVRKGFDVILGNPPFVNAIEGSLGKALKKFLSATSPLLAGTADLAYRFVALAHRITTPIGAVGLIQPKGFLNADSASGLRTTLIRERRPSLLYIPVGGDFFEGASAYVCAISLRSSSECKVADAESPSAAVWQSGEVVESNWWRAAQQILGKINVLADIERVSLKEHFEIVASMTTGDAYAVKPFVFDDKDSLHLRLVTTGLIDPYTCSWGKVSCRYLGANYSFPTIACEPGLPRSIARRLEGARRPKILMAGLCDRLEAFVDTQAKCIGAVSTFTIFHPTDDVDRLNKLCEWLNSAEATALVREQLGAASVGGGYMTLKKQTIQQLVIPKSVVV